MGVCYSKQPRECELCQVIYEDLDKFTELPMISPVLVRQNGYIKLKRMRHMTINQLYKNELMKMQ
jgi:hypothetical protein